MDKPEKFKLPNFLNIFHQRKKNGLMLSYIYQERYFERKRHSKSGSLCVTMRRVLRRQQGGGARDEEVLVHSTEELQREDHEKISSLVAKPFRCLVGGGRQDADKEYALIHLSVAPDEQYVPPGGETAYGFEAVVQEGKKKKNKPRSFRRKKEQSMEEMPPPWNTDPMALSRGNRSFEGSYYSGSLNSTSNSFPRNRSLEYLPPGSGADSIRRNGSFADAIPPGKKNDPLDGESIRDVQKALREMERKLQAADLEGKKVSRTKVMKALLTVVDQLDEEQYILGSGGGGGVDSFQSPSKSSNTDTSADLYRTWTGDAAEEEEIARDRAQRNMMQMRELTITPNKDYLGRPESRMSSKGSDRSPWKEGKLSVSKAGVKASSTAETEVEPDNISSSSDDDDEEEGTLLSEETEQSDMKGRKKKQGSQKGSFADAVYSEEGLINSDGTQDSRKKKERSRKGSFAHAVSPSAARSSKQSFNSNFDLFNLNMEDPAVRDALSDLLWIPSPSQTKNVQSSPAAVVSPDHSHPSATREGMLRSETQSLAYKEEQEYYDKPDVGEESTATTTELSSHTTGTSTSHNNRESSWWRRNRGTIKPPSKDTPNVQEQPRPQIQTRVTVTPNDNAREPEYSEPWRTEHRWPKN